MPLVFNLSFPVIATLFHLVFFLNINYIICLFVASAIDLHVPDSQRFPFSIVWAPLPVITWILPFIGHLGVTDSHGRVHDFQSAYSVVTDSFMTGDVLKTYRFSPAQLRGALPSNGNNVGGSASAGSSNSNAALTVGQAWDRAVHSSDRKYEQTIHNICCNNCHHHTADALTAFGFPHTMLGAWALITFRGRYTSWGALLCTYIPLLIIIAIALALGLGLGLKR